MKIKNTKRLCGEIMKTNIYTEYTCEMCGRTYDNKDDCIKCENSHITNFKISGYEFPEPRGYGNSINFEGKNCFPSKLILLFEKQNGENVEKEYSLDDGWINHEK